MKQHITVEQLQQLSDEQKERLREWWKLKEGDCVLLTNGEKGFVGNIGIFNGEKRIIKNKGTIYDYEQYWVRKCLPLLSIGQMVELLNKKHPEGIAFHNDWGESWSVLVQDSEDDDPPGSFISQEVSTSHVLADALWQAVKEVL